MGINGDLLNRTQWKSPPNHGWLECKLNKTELDYIWKCIDYKKMNCNKFLAGNIDSSYALEDVDDWFFKNTISPLMDVYKTYFHDLGKLVPIEVDVNDLHYKMPSWWVNFQKQNDFNPMHGHTGLYSFVVWLKIPTEYVEQNTNFNTNSPEKSSFSFVYTNILGDIWTHMYGLGKEYEGTLLLFPSHLKHLVQPFYNCNEDRISVSGNILLKV